MPSPGGADALGLLSQPSPSPSLHTRAVWGFVCSERKEAPFSAVMVSLLPDNWGPRRGWALTSQRMGGRGQRQEAAWTDMQVAPENHGLPGP